MSPPSIGLPMWEILRAIRLLIVGAAVCIPISTSPAQQRIRDVREVRVEFEHVDPIAFTFGLDTVSIRSRLARALANAAIHVVHELRAPRLGVLIHVPRTSPGLDALVTVTLRIDGDSGSALPAAGGAIWRSNGSQGTIPSFRLIPSTVSRLLDRELSKLVSDRAKVASR